jgi:hypothetical protein
MRYSSSAVIVIGNYTGSGDGIETFLYILAKSQQDQSGASVGKTRLSWNLKPFGPATIMETPGP